MEGKRERRREGRKEKGKKRGREGRERSKEGGGEGGKEGGRERGREGGREGRTQNINIDPLVFRLRNNTISASAFCQFRFKINFIKNFVSINLRMQLNGYDTLKQLTT